jgi:hypothetical protein
MGPCAALGKALAASSGVIRGATVDTILPNSCQLFSFKSSGPEERKRTIKKKIRIKKMIKSGIMIKSMPRTLAMS